MGPRDNHQPELDNIYQSQQKAYYGSTVGDLSERSPPPVSECDLQAAAGCNRPG